MRSSAGSTCVGSRNDSVLCSCITHDNIGVFVKESHAGVQSIDGLSCILSGVFVSFGCFLEDICDRVGFVYLMSLGGGSFLKVNELCYGRYFGLE